MIDKHLADMQRRGWTITFPAFKETRAYAVEVTKGDVKHGAGWVDTHDGSLFKAIALLASQARESDGVDEAARTNCTICGMPLGLEPLAFDENLQAHTACIEKQQEVGGDQ